MDFLLLGPLEVRSARETLPLGGPRQRALLADLVLHAGSVVSMDVLIDDLWGGESPPTAEAVVQNAISRLRKTLGREAIETRAPGYVLRVDSGAIDARRFERLVRDARAAAAGRALGGARATRSRSGAGRRSPTSRSSRSSRTRSRASTSSGSRRSRTDSRPRSSSAVTTRSIAEASALAAQHPARERLSRLLMLALHRAGRQQEALDAYEATRRALDELGGSSRRPRHGRCR